MDGLGQDLTFDVRTRENGDALVTLSGELDIANVDRLDAAVAPVIAAAPMRLVVDVSKLGFADSSAIALWVRWSTGVGQIELLNCSPLLRRVIQSMGLEQKLRLSG